jgi:hypothetical protein
VIHSSLSELTSESAVADLPASDFTVPPHTFGRIVAHEFQQQPEIPGVLICDGTTLLAMISREKFLEQLPRCFSENCLFAPGKLRRLNNCARKP